MMKKMVLLILLSAALLHPFGWMAGRGEIFAAETPAEDISPEMLQRWQQLTPEARARLQDRYKAFEELPEARKELLLQRYARFQEMTPEKRQRLLDRYRQWRTFSPEQRDAIRKTFERFKQLPPEEQDELRRQFQSMQQAGGDERQQRQQELQQRFQGHIRGHSDSMRSPTGPARLHGRALRPALIPKSAAAKKIKSVCHPFATWCV